MTLMFHEEEEAHFSPEWAIQKDILDLLWLAAHLHLDLHVILADIGKGGVEAGEPGHHVAHAQNIGEDLLLQKQLQNRHH